ncbi:transposase [Rhodococcus sp. Leaf7]|uniref:IS110 family transposase n=1 Tax=unclassified Rhodococcus (in: high G+C Gram-positive bacteria) TaxID=192944 RepID=UPI0006FE648C|nr:MULTISPECIES: IS110 family transposase [unclassified Rhodococcus (in: high G+C Gram-positive bacteria)]KQU06337.1 transposase [Rhodococcus sp. Leaf7]KQU41854.1 transposase [Rhodococcus sp. Leaf247]
MITRKYDVYCGIDVGKTAHHAVALAADGTRILSRPLPQDENAITALLGELATAGSVLVVVDQPRNIGAMPVAVARAAGADVAYLSGLRMRRIADLYPGNAKTDVRDAFIIADAARTLPDTLLPIAQHDDIVEGLRMLAGFDADLAAEENRINGRIRSVLLTVHPALERAIGKHLYRPVGVAVLAAFGGPVGLAATTSTHLREVTKAAAPRIGDAVADSIEAALGEQTVTVPGAEKADFVLRTLARQLHQVREARADLEVQFVAELDRHPAGPILTSMPGVAARTAVTMLVEIADIDRFQNAGHLAVYAGVAPRTHRSGTSIRGEHRQHSGNARLKRAMYLSAFASLREPASRAYYDRKRTEGKNHRSALICLARRRSNVLYAMLSSGTTYRSATELSVRRPGPADGKSY